MKYKSDNLFLLCLSLGLVFILCLTGCKPKDIRDVSIKEPSYIASEK